MRFDSQVRLTFLRLFHLSIKLRWIKLGKRLIRNVCIIFDRTINVCEAMVIGLRYIIEDWVIQRCICRLMLLAKSMTGEEVARQIIMVLSTELGITSALLVGCMHDYASVNEVAMRMLKIVYNQVVDIGCFSHTLDHIGERMHMPILHKFLKAWIYLLKTRLLWKEWIVLSYLLCHQMVELV